MLQPLDKSNRSLTNDFVHRAMPEDYNDFLKSDVWLDLKDFYSRRLSYLRGVLESGQLKVNEEGVWQASNMDEVTLAWIRAEITTIKMCLKLPFDMATDSELQLRQEMKKDENERKRATV